MNRSIKLWQFVGFALTSFLGTFLHFLYDLTGENIIAAPFSAINESTWEHMKILFVPMFLFAVIERFFFKEYNGFWCIKLKGILLGLILIPTLFYTYNGIFGTSPAWVNIVIFFISAAVSFIYETKQFGSEPLSYPCKTPKLAFAILCLILAAFVIFTFSPPSIPLFADPLAKMPPS